MASLMRWSTAVSIARWAPAGQIVDVEQRHRAAGDLLRAADTDSGRAPSGGRGIERRGEADRKRHAAGALHQIGEHVGRQRQAFALGQRCTVRRARICVAGFTSSA